MTLYSDPHPIFLDLVLQPCSLKLGSCKFNFIINIILRSDVVAKSKILGYGFAEKPKIFKFLFFLIFFIQKNDPQHRAGHVSSILQNTQVS